QEDSTRATAERALFRMLYPEAHPYSRPAIGDRETVQRLTSGDCRAFHSRWYAAPGMIVTLAGAFDADDVRGRVKGWLAQRPAPPPLPDLRVSPSGEAGRARFLMPHKSQADIIIGGSGVPRDHPDFFPLWMVN